MNLTAEEEILLRVCRRLTGLDKTRCLRYLMRRGALLEVLNYKKMGGFKLPDDLESYVADFFTGAALDNAL